MITSGYGSTTSHPLLTPLKRWARDEKLRSIRFSFSSSSSYFATAIDEFGNPRVKWDGLPSDVTDRLQASIGVAADGSTDYGFKVGERPVQVVVGIEGAWVLVKSNGGVAWDLKGSYPKLDMELEKAIGGNKKVVVC